jgi:hypothetical protein
MLRGRPGYRRMISARASAASCRNSSAPRPGASLKGPFGVLRVARHTAME